MEENKLKGPIEYIKEAWSIYTKKENFMRFAKVMLVLSFLNILTSFVFRYLSGYNFIGNSFASNVQDLESPILFVILLALQIIIGVWILTTRYVLIVSNESKIDKIFIEGFRKSWKFFVTTAAVFVRTVLLGMLMVIIGYVLSSILLASLELSSNLITISIIIVTTLSLIYPLYLGIRYSLSIYLTIEKGMRARESLKESKVLTKSIFWKLLGRYFVLGLCVVAVVTIIQLIPNIYLSSLISTFMSPFFMLPYYLIYKDLVINTN